MRRMSTIIDVDLSRYFDTIRHSVLLDKIAKRVQDLRVLHLVKQVKELHALEIDRTSCTRFRANQFRVLLTAAAYALMQELRLQAALTDCARAQVWTLRERFLKLGARVMVSMRRLVVHLPQSFPFLAAFRQIAMGLRASTA